MELGVKIVQADFHLVESQRFQMSALLLGQEMAVRAHGEVELVRLKSQDHVIEFLENGGFAA